MKSSIDQAVELIEKAAAELELEPLSPEARERLLALYARVQSVARSGVAALTPWIDDAHR